MNTVRLTAALHSKMDVSFHFGLTYTAFRGQAVVLRYPSHAFVHAAALLKLHYFWTKQYSPYTLRIISIIA